MDTNQKNAQIPRGATSRILPNLALYVQTAATLPAFTAADKEDLLRGIKMYQNHSFVRHKGATKYDIVWQSGEASVRHYVAQNDKVNAALFIVPSMINKCYILDLLPHKSFISWLQHYGFDVYLFDWGLPVNDGGMADIDAVMHGKLCCAARELFSDISMPVHALGYCMGGTLLAGLVHECGDLFRSNVFLAAPWNFYAGDRMLGNAILSGTPAALQMIEAGGRLPATWIEGVFAAAQAEKSVRKYIEFARGAQDRDRARLFVAVEDWLHDGMDLPGDIGRTCLLDWYRDNATQKGEWLVNGKAVDLSQIKTPSLVVASDNDRLVPAASTLAMAQQLSSCDVMRPACGHIGMMTSKNAEGMLWSPLAAWLMAH